MISIIRKIQNFFADQVDVQMAAHQFGQGPNFGYSTGFESEIPIEAYSDSATALHFGMPSPDDDW